MVIHDGPAKLPLLEIGVAQVVKDRSILHAPIHDLLVEPGGLLIFPGLIEVSCFGIEGSQIPRGRGTVPRKSSVPQPQPEGKEWRMENGE